MVKRRRESDSHVACGIVGQRKEFLCTNVVDTSRIEDAHSLGKRKCREGLFDRGDGCSSGLSVPVEADGKLPPATISSTRRSKKSSSSQRSDFFADLGSEGTLCGVNSLRMEATNCGLDLTGESHMNGSLPSTDVCLPRRSLRSCSSRRLDFFSESRSKRTSIDAVGCYAHKRSRVNVSGQMSSTGLSPPKNITQRSKVRVRASARNDLLCIRICVL